MYDIGLFSELFRECDIICMTDEFYYALQKVMDDNVSASVYRFILKFEQSLIRNDNNGVANALSKSVDRMKNILGPTIVRNTMHKEAESRDLFSTIKLLDVMTALDTIDNRNKLEKDLTWLLRNKASWMPYIEPRKKTDFQKFHDKVMELSHTSEMMYYQFLNADIKLDRNEYLEKYMQSNKEFFYKANEKQRSTSMSIFMSKRQDLEIILNALRYQKIVNKTDLNIFQARDFRIRRG